LMKFMVHGWGKMTIGVQDSGNKSCFYDL
jgi:hypothetical protein